MHRSVHQPPPAAVVAALVRAGVSLSTALAMEQYKAAEILELLRADAAPVHRVGSADGRARI